MRIVDDLRANGDAVVVRAEFDGYLVAADQLRVGEDEFDAAERAVGGDVAWGTTVCPGGA